MTNTITEARVREVLLHTPLLTAEDFARLTAQANADCDEGAEFMPYYKLALVVLMDAFARAVAVAERCLDDSCYGAVRRLRRAVLADAVQLAKLSFRPCGLGPDTSPERAAQVDRINADFDKPLRGGVAVTDDDGSAD